MFGDEFKKKTNKNLLFFSLFFEISISVLLTITNPQSYKGNLEHSRLRPNLHSLVIYMTQTQVSNSYELNNKYHRVLSQVNIN